MRKNRALKMLAVLLLATGVNAYGQTTRRPGNRAQAPSAGAVKRVGVFTNMRFTREHQYGYSVELWQERDRLFGLLLVSAGLIGDTPTGLLEDVVFDSKTGKLSFRARLSTGATVNKKNEEMPTRDVYRFAGTLKGQRLAGVLEHTDASDPSATATKTNVSLRRSKSESGSMTAAKSFEEWKKEADEILTLRGPKW